MQLNETLLNKINLLTKKTVPDFIDDQNYKMISQHIISINTSV